MNILKNFEAVFVVALGVAACASFLNQSPDELTAASQQTPGASVATPSRMAVVTVAGKRMSVHWKTNAGWRNRASSQAAAFDRQRPPARAAITAGALRAHVTSPFGNVRRFPPNLFQL
jgi:allophanate hydrolase subunit 1